MDADVDALALPHCAKGMAVCTVLSLRVRAAPVDGAIVGSLQQDEVVTVWARDGEWAIVQNGAGLTGWASVKYLRLGTLTP